MLNCKVMATKEQLLMTDEELVLGTSAPQGDSYDVVASSVEAVMVKDLDPDKDVALEESAKEPASSESKLPKPADSESKGLTALDIIKNRKAGVSGKTPMGVIADRKRGIRSVDSVLDLIKERKTGMQSNATPQSIIADRKFNRK